MKPRKAIILVCMGNTCRSVMAEALLKKALQDFMGDSAKDIQVVSAGVFANCGDPASYYAKTAMEKLGLDISDHKARCVSAEDLNRSYLVLTMTAAIKDKLAKNYPTAKSKIMTLTEFAGLTEELGWDIKDPYGLPLEAYKAGAEQISKAVEVVAKKIKDSFESRRDSHEDRHRE